MNRDPLDLVLVMAGIFDALGIQYYLCGSLASSVHGEPRATRDIDFVASIAPRQAKELCLALGKEFYADEIAIREAAQSRGHFNLVYLTSMMKVDVFVPADPSGFAEEIRRASSTPIGQGTVRVASAEDTIIGKLLWYRLGGQVSDRQWTDILGVLRIQNDRLDLAYLKQKADDKDVLDLLERALFEARK